MKRKIMTQGNGVDKKILDIVGWIFSVILLPLLPILVKVVVKIFTSISISIIDPNELLYYSFIVGIIVLQSLNSSGSSLLFAFLSYIVGILCLICILLIAFIATGKANINVLSFSIASSIACSCIGIIYKITEQNMLRKTST